MVAKEYPRGLPLHETRIYQPKGERPTKPSLIAIIGKKVTVFWRNPYFSLMGYAKDKRTGELIGLSFINWYGWVPEARSYIPESDLVPEKKESK